MEALDQIWVTLKHSALGVLPAALRGWASILLSIGPLVGAFAGLFALTTLVERKLLGRIQNRPGPNRVGPFGILQPAADGLKAVFKENVVPRAADRLVYTLAPVVMVIPAILALAVIPVGRNMTALDLDAGVLYFFAVGAGAELAVFMAGWASRNKYALLGAMRALAQMISYELPLILSTIPVLMLTGTLSPSKIVEAQNAYSFGLAQWHVFTPWGFAAFWLFLIAGMAEANRSPFDIPEGESEIVAGHLIEYSGFKFALFFLGEYLGLFAMTSLAITLFLGGWTAPVSFLAWIPSWMWFFAKLTVLMLFFIWVRGTVPRLRIDQLMNFAWKLMLPLSLINIVNAGLWHHLGSGPLRWLVSATLVVAPYFLLGQGLAARARWAPRTYRWVE
ncbi:MAG: NADH-quinone oxidoreductase subunit NuoH [Verrucomicrobia bacterium]|nr:NADH-quinone oxidoreductase subunit NuoH [Verrucomicrobiota bacterium]